MAAEQGGLGREPYTAFGRGLDECGVEQGVRMVGYEQQWAVWKWSADALDPAECRDGQPRETSDPGLARLCGHWPFVAPILRRT